MSRDDSRLHEPVDPAHPSEPHPDPAVQALIADGWLEESDQPIDTVALEHAVSLVREVDADRHGGVAALRAELYVARSRRASSLGPRRITKDVALAEIRRYRERFPSAPVEVTAVHLVRQVDDWDEITAILTALAEIEKEGAPDA